MANTYNQKIGRNTDWGGDATTGGLPVAGARVQEFIKEELNSKFGSVFLDTGTSKYLCFANEETQREYELTGNQDLILGSFEAISNYSVGIIDTTENKSVLATRKNNTLSFKFNVINNNTHIPTGEPVKIEYTFNNGGTILTFTEEVYPHDLDEESYTPVSFIIDDYIKIGTNNITIKIIGKNTSAVGQMGIVFEVLDLIYTPSFDYNTAWNTTDNTIYASYTINCARQKYIEWYIDGVKAMQDIVITDITGGDIIPFSISHLAPGVHTLQTRAYVMTASETKFYSENNFYMFAVKGGSSPCVLIHKVFENGNLVGPDEVLKIDTAQFEAIEFDWSFYDPQTREMGVTFSYDGTQISTVTKNNGSGIEYFSYRPVYAGTGTLTITIFDEESGEIVYTYEIEVTVNESSTALSEASTGLLLKLNAMGRSNDEADKTEKNPGGTRNVWTYTADNGTTYDTTFNGFAWNSQQGWYDNALVMSDGAYVEINIKPMERDWALYGGTIEVDIETFDVENDDAKVFMVGDGYEESSYVMVTATQAKIKVRGTSNPLETRFRDNDRMHLCFIGNAQGTSEDSNLIYIVNNGVLERAVNFNNGDQLASMATIKIGDIDGNGKVKCRLRSIKVYNRALSVDEAFGNYVIDSDNVQKIYEDNNVFKDGSTTEVDYDKIVQKIPVLIFTGNVPLMNKYADKSYTDYFDLEYTNMQDPTRNFTAFHVEVKLQGTSSLGYPRKNYKVKTKNGKLGQSDFDATNIIFDPETRRLYKKDDPTQEIDYNRNLTICWTFDYLGAVKKNGKIKVKSADTQKVNRWTIKADYMESSMSHNTGVAKMWNEIFKNVELRNTNTYIDSANEWLSGNKGELKRQVELKLREKSQNGYVCRTQAQKVAEVYDTGEVRTAVDGFPIVMFYRLTHDSDLVFMGQYNFNNDKGSEELFGFEDIILEDENGNETDTVFDASQVECWEGLSNTNPIGLFKDNSKFYQEWDKTYESRYPDQDDNTYTLEHLKILNDWVLSTRHEEDTEIDSSNTISINANFARKINEYQYGYDINNITDSFRYIGGDNLPDTPENRQRKFNVEKWEHFDVWKLAGYYIYLMRYGAVDQFVKNTMLTTEGIGKFGGQYKKWYFINYDNDCVFGLRNNGVLAFSYDMDRNTVDPDWDPSQFEEGYSASTVYAMMGHDSTLWNNLERDEEFMRMVRDLDDAMHSIAGGAPLTYQGFCQIFDTEQTDCWPARIYNANERYKYIFPFKGIGDASGQSTNNLWMLQGTRKAHRHWWLSNRLEYYDAKWISGDYKNAFLEMKANVPTGTKFDIVAGADFYYAWGNNKTLIESNVKLHPGDEYSFVSPTPQVQGDPIRIYAITKIRELDLTDYFAGITTLIFTGIINETTNELRKVVIGREDRSNIALTNIDSISLMGNVQYLDITNCQAINAFSVSSLPKLSIFKAKGTTLQAFEPADGSKFELAELPTTIQTLRLSNINIALANLKYAPTLSLRNLTLANKSGIDLSYYNKIIRPWLDLLKNSDNKGLYSYANMNISNINWSFSDINHLYAFEEFSQRCQSMNLQGKIDFTGYGQLKREEMERLKSIFGENCFSKYNTLYIICPTSIFIETDKTEMVAGRSNKFYTTIYPARPENSFLEYTIVSGKSDNRPGVTLVNRVEGGKEVAYLESEEIACGRDSIYTIHAKLKTTGDIDRDSETTFKILDPTYPDSIDIIGDSSVYVSEPRYDYSIRPLTSDGKAPIGSYTVEWTLSGDSGLDFINTTTSGPDNDNQLVYHLFIKDAEHEPATSATLWLKTMVTCHNGDIREDELRVLVLNHNVIMTDESNPVVMRICSRNEWCESDNAMMKSEAEEITNIGQVFAGVQDDFSFNEFKYFTNVTSLSLAAFQGSRIKSIVLPESLTELGNYSFENAAVLTSVTFSTGITEIPEGCFKGCASLSNIVLPSGCTTIKNYAFGGTNITQMHVNGTIFSGDSLVVNEGLVEIAGLAFELDTWTKDSRSNKMTFIQLPVSFIRFGEEFTRGKFVKEYHVLEDNPRYCSVNGLLLNKAKSLLYSYPPERDGDTFDPANEPGDIQLNPEQYGSYAFYYAKKLQHFIINVGASQMGEYCFYESGIVNIDLTPSNLIITLPGHCFDSCMDFTGLTFNTLVNPLKTIGPYCFAHCPSMTEMTLPDGVVTIRDNAFNSCSGLTEINIPDTVLSMEHDAITQCNALTEVVLPPFMDTSTETKGDEDDDRRYYVKVISDCENITTVTLPIFSYDKPEGYDVVDSNDGHLLLPDTYMYYEAAVQACIDNNITENYKIVEHMVSTIVNTCLVHSDGGTMGFSTYINACPNFVEFKLNEQDNGDYANIYDGCLYIISDVSGNTIPCKLHSVPCGKLAMEFRNDVVKIDAYAAAASKLVNVTMPNSITAISEYAFAYSPNLARVVCSDNLEELSNSVFVQSSNMTYIYLGRKLRSIGFMCFWYCTKLSEIVVLAKTAANAPAGNIFSYVGDNATGERVLYVTYGSTGYEIGNGGWTGLLKRDDNPSYAFTKKVLPVQGTLIYVRFNDGITEGREIVATTESGSFTRTGSFVTDGEYAGCYSYYFDSASEAMDGEKLRFTDETNGGISKGEITLYFNVTDYTVDVLAGGRMLRVFGAPKEEENVTLTKTEYALLNAKLSQVSSIVNDLLKK